MIKPTLGGATFLLAIFGAVGWGLSLWSVSPILAILLGAVAMIAPIVAASLTGPAMKGGGAVAWGCVLIFTVMDGASNGNSFWQFEKVGMEAINKPAMERYQADLVVLTQARDNALIKLNELPLPSADGAIRRMSTYVETQAILKANVEAAKADLDALEAPVPARLFNEWASFTVMMLVSFALILGWLGVHRMDHKKPRKRKAKPKAAPAPKSNARNFPKGGKVVDFGQLALNLAHRY